MPLLLLMPYDLREDGAVIVIVCRILEAFRQVEDTFKVNIITVYESVKAV